MVFIDFFNTPLIDLKINKILIFSKNIGFYIDFFGDFFCIFDMHFHLQPFSISNLERPWQKVFLKKRGP